MTFWLTWHWCWQSRSSLHLAAHGLCLPASAHELHVAVHRCPHGSTAPHLIGHAFESRSQHLATKTCLSSLGHVRWTLSVHFLRVASFCWLQIVSCSCFSSSHSRILTYNSKQFGLNWKHHINYICEKRLKFTGIFYRLRFKISCEWLRNITLYTFFASLCYYGK